MSRAGILPEDVGVLVGVTVLALVVGVDAIWRRAFGLPAPALVIAVSFGLALIVLAYALPLLLLGNP